MTDPANDEPATGDLAEDAQAISSCNGVSTVLLYSEDTWELELPNAFAAAQDPCTRYYVDLPALSNDKTFPRGGANRVRALGPNFHAMAEFAWGDWRQWIEASPGTRDWAEAGRIFRQRMIDAGYDVASGDTWVINEFPLSTHSGADGVWDNERNAVRGLHDGGGMPSAGVVFVAGMGETLQNFAVYKPNVENWLAQDAYWNDMDKYVRWYSQEVYAEPHQSCESGSDVLTNARHLSEYLEHVPRLAANAGAATATAHAYFEHAYIPLVNAAWNSNSGFGDNVVSLGEFEQFSREQIYATHVWAANHSYPGRRIGFAWAPKNSTADQDNELSAVIATSTSRAYTAAQFYGRGKYACSTSGSRDGCACQLSGAFNTGWDAFGGP